MHIPSDTNVYLAGGAIIIGTFIISRAENIHIYGRGCLYLARFERFSGLNAIRISHGRNISIEGIHLINPPHYSVYVGGAENVRIEDITSFSCEGWSDGIDIMSSRNVTVKDCFLRTSDDCVAIYGRRWDYSGDSRNILEHIRFENLDILEHREHQAEYLGCLAINAGDRNTVRDVCYENIRIEPFMHGKILDFQVKCNPDYNPAPGRQISNIRLKDIHYRGSGEVPSRIRGYDADRLVSDVCIENLYSRGRKAETLADAGIEAGPYAENVRISG